MMLTPVPPKPERVDWSLSALLAVQVLTLFVAIPFGTTYPSAHLLLDACHIAFAMIAATMLARQRIVQLILLAALVLLSAGPVMGHRLIDPIGIGSDAMHEVIAFTAFGFNFAVTVLVARHVFGPGRVTAHRVRGAILVYLNVAALFAILYGAIAMRFPGAIALTTGGSLTTEPGGQTAALTYFSLTTITTTGFGDLAPVAPLARSLANLESVIGQLFPATLLARIVALHIAHQGDGRAVK
jgi:hypothetical protein